MNLRSSCESHLILVERFDIETVSAWLGNSPEIVRKHYLQLIGADIDRASSLKEFSAQWGADGHKHKKATFPSVEAHENAVEYTRQDSNCAVCGLANSRPKCSPKECESAYSPQVLRIIADINMNLEPLDREALLGWLKRTK